MFVYSKDLILIHRCLGLLSILHGFDVRGTALELKTYGLKSIYFHKKKHNLY